MTVIVVWASFKSFDSAFSRQFEALNLKDVVLWGLGVAGNSTNVLKALIATCNLSKTIDFTG